MTSGTGPIKPYEFEAARMPSQMTKVDKEAKKISGVVRGQMNFLSGEFRVARNMPFDHKATLEKESDLPSEISPRR